MMDAVAPQDEGQRDPVLTRFRERFSEAFGPGKPHVETGDHMLDLQRPSPPEILKPAAVLIPIIQHEFGATVLLTQRTATLSAHAGQIAFPGGRVDASDAFSPLTALREAREEIGLMSDQVQLLGSMHRYATGSGYEITPVVGVVQPPLSLSANPDEVSAIFEVPLEFLMTGSNYLKLELERNGTKRQAYAIPYKTHYIWGVTAGILKTLYESLYPT
ncbi:MAG: CoA pyrophosphatase [Alphaproteobacteria bacterium]